MKMSHYYSSAFALSAALVCGCASAGKVAVASPDPTVPAYSVDAVRAHVDALAHDSMLGRLTTGPGIQSASRYIDSHFAGLGLGGLLGGPRVVLYEFAKGKIAPNVVAIIPGNARPHADSMIVLVAHFDHVGTISTSGDSIFNGADDNASGTAALLEAARLLKNNDALPYTVVFAAVSGEESGLVGSRVLLASGMLDPSRVIAAINMDMVGRGAPSRLEVIGGRDAFLAQLAMDVARRTPSLGLAPRMEIMPANARARSDHGSFLERGVPAIHLFTGFHADYHKVSDAAERVDADKVARIAAFVVKITERVAARAAE